MAVRSCSLKQLSWWEWNYGPK